MSKRKPAFSINQKIGKFTGDRRVLGLLAVRGAAPAAGPAAQAQHGNSMTTAAIPLDRFARSPWIRVTVTDRGGKRAWSNPIWLG